ncbi:MAG: hypothetical protein GY774_36190 [Planctomycetes bacterium]|nr:hypothetical protein [Planctomycetota bacterium]
MTDPSRLTRRELGAFLPTPRSVIAFEQLFNMIPSRIISTEDELAIIESNIAVLTAAVAANALAITVIQAQITILENQIAALENPGVLFATVDQQANTDAYGLIISTGVTVTMPKCSTGILGRIWTYTLGETGTCTIETDTGDSFLTPDVEEETEVILNRRGSTIDFRCTSATTWSFA